MSRWFGTRHFLIFFLLAYRVLCYFFSCFCILLLSLILGLVIPISLLPSGVPVLHPHFFIIVSAGLPFRSSILFAMLPFIPFTRILPLAASII